MKEMMIGYDPWEVGLDPKSWVGDEVVCQCPYHNDHSPSFVFNVRDGLFYCFSCGESGNAEKLVKQTGGIVSWHRIESYESTAKSVPWRRLLEAPLAYDDEYLYNRRVSNSQVTKWGIRKLGGSIIFPITAYHGDVEGVLVRQKTGTPRYLSYGYKPPLFPVVDFLVNQRTAIEYGLPAPVLVEGIFGVLRLDSFNIPAAATLGATPSIFVPRHLHYCTIAFDDDEAGYLGAGKLLRASNEGMNVQALYPGIEADELTEGQAMAIYHREAATTADFKVLMEFVHDHEHFDHAVRSYNLKIAFN